MKENSLIKIVLESLNKKDSFPIAFLFFTLTIGGLSISRIIGGNDTNIWFIGEIRNWAVLLLLLFLIAHRSLSTQRIFLYKSVNQWTNVVVLLHIYILLSSFWSANNHIKFQDFFDILLLIALFYIALYYFAKSPERKIELILILSFITSLVLIIISYFGYRTLGEELQTQYVGSIGLARIAGAGVLSTLYIWIKYRKNYILIFTTILFCIVLISGNRGPVLALLIVFLFIYFILFSKTYKLLLGILSVLTIFILYNFFFLFMDEVYYYLNLFLQINVSQLAFENIYLAGREQLFEEVWEIFMDHFYFGAGLGNFQVLGSASYPHNLILNILGDGGMTGFIIFIILLFLILGRWFRPKTIEHISSFSIALFYFICSLFAGTYYDARFMWIFFILYMMPQTKPDM